ncbi:Fas apoptotic inhibitory molecule 3 [Heterocephalus glaber]|uniref:Fas apoptotic inhibitory molecule 3 n=1 Tax=Heterocephalus glaber TaxID=10181 RepID=G5BP17_HETGA|nr:Fas apoptotic inhibitory molecule 3 [Heterocephalus glaber]
MTPEGHRGDLGKSSFSGRPWVKSCREQAGELGADLALCNLRLFPKVKMIVKVSGALKILPEVELEGALGGSVVIECPLLEKGQVRMYLCRQMANPGICSTVVSSNFIKDEYRHRVTLMPCSDRKLFLVEMTGLTERDSGVYACGLGIHTDKGKTLKVTLSVHNEYEPFWEEEPMSESQSLWLHKLLQQQMPSWLEMVPHAAGPPELPSKDATAERTEAPPVQRSAAATPTAHRPQTPGASLAAAAKPPPLLPSTTASKASAQEGLLGPQEASYNHRTWLHKQRASTPGSPARRRDLGFHILIPSALGLLLLALLGLVLRRALQRRRVASAGGTFRPWGREGQSFQRPAPSHALGRSLFLAQLGARWPPCPLQGGPTGTGRGLHTRSLFLRESQRCPRSVPDAPWLPVPSLKTSFEYVTICHQPAARREDAESSDYINIPSLTFLPS